MSRQQLQRSQRYRSVQDPSPGWDQSPSAAAAGTAHPCQVAARSLSTPQHSTNQVGSRCLLRTAVCIKHVPQCMCRPRIRSSGRGVPAATTPCCACNNIPAFDLTHSATASTKRVSGKGGMLRRAAPAAILAALRSGLRQGETQAHGVAAAAKQDCCSSTHA